MADRSGKQIFVRMNPADYELVQAEAARTGKPDAAVLRDAFLASRPATGAPTRKDGAMAEVFLCEMGQLADESRQALREAGIVVVEVKDPSRCQFIRSGEKLSSSDMLWAAMDAIRRDFGSYSKGEKQREQFALNMWKLVAAAHEWTCCWLPYTGPRGERWAWRMCGGEMPGHLPPKHCRHWHHKTEVFMA